ncbi:recombinase family protein [Rufibacter latericius]|uniref:Recombinase family protein n=1 Tax=Rufibacter latericius TaxID=2487040 RepID=A0A3M9MBR8_9BACT|nr:recombinase family protein [Rufibacter latericius]RNI23022.1 recombinase family protein [Rufibacter latericius]
MKPVAIFTRVSKTSQDYDCQVSDLTKYAASKGYNVVATINEKVSGSKTNEERQGIIDLLQLAEAGKIKRVLVSEVSRLGRNTTEVLKVVEALTKTGVSVFILNHQIETFNADGKANSMAHMFLTLLAEFSRMEKETLIERINSGLDEARKKGVKLGRKEGSTKTKEALLVQYKEVVGHLKKGQSVRNAAKICAVSTGTVLKVKKAMTVEKPTPIKC